MFVLHVGFMFGFSCCWFFVYLFYVVLYVNIAVISFICVRLSHFQWRRQCLVQKSTNRGAETETPKASISVNWVKNGEGVPFPVD